MSTNKLLVVQYLKKIPNNTKLRILKKEKHCRPFDTGDQSNLARIKNDRLFHSKSDVPAILNDYILYSYCIMFTVFEICEL